MDLEEQSVHQIFDSLMKNSNEILNSADTNEEIVNNINAVKMFEEVFCCQDETYDKVLTKIRENKPTDNIIENTVGAYLYSCFDKQEMIECNPHCLTGFKNPQNSICDTNCFVKNGSLRKVNNATDDHANIYLLHEQQLENNDVKYLLDNEIKRVTVFHQVGNTIQWKHGPSIDLQLSLPSEETKKVEPIQLSLAQWIVIIAILSFSILTMIFINRK